MPMCAADLEEFLLAHGADVLTEDEDAAGVGPEQAVGELEQDAFAAACGAEDDAHLAGRTWKEMFSRTGFCSKPMETSSKTTTGSVEEPELCAGVAPIGAHLVHLRRCRS